MKEIYCVTLARNPQQMQKLSACFLVPGLVSFPVDAFCMFCPACGTCRFLAVALHNRGRISDTTAGYSLTDTEFHCAIGRAKSWPRPMLLAEGVTPLLTRTIEQKQRDLSKAWTYRGFSRAAVVTGEPPGRLLLLGNETDKSTRGVDQ